MENINKEEGMICLSPQRVQSLYAEIENNAKNNKEAGFHNYAARDECQLELLKELFGSKCLSDHVTNLDANVDSLSPSAVKEAHMEKINGIIKDGKAYKAVEIDEVTPCEYCDFCEECSNSASNIEPICSEFIGDSCIFRYSPELTDKLNKQ